MSSILDEEESEGQNVSEKLGMNTSTILKMILRRLKAEIKAEGKDHIKLLGLLLNERDPQVKIAA